MSKHWKPFGSWGKFGLLSIFESAKTGRFEVLQQESNKHSKRRASYRQIKEHRVACSKTPNGLLDQGYHDVSDFSEGLRTCRKTSSSREFAEEGEERLKSFVADIAQSFLSITPVVSCRSYILFSHLPGSWHITGGAYSMHRPVRIGSTATRIRDGGLARRTQFSPDYKAELVDPSVVFQSDKEEWRNGIGDICSCAWEKQMHINDPTPTAN